MLRTQTSNLMEKNDTKWTQQQEKSTPKNHTQHFRQTHVWTYYFEEHSCISQIRKIKLKSRTMKWDRENPYLFLDVWRRHDAKMEAFSKETRSVWVRFSWERKWIVTKSSRKNWRDLKTDPVFAKHELFATEVSRQQVARSSRQNTQRKNCEKFSKCFSQMEGLPARESRAELRKSLCTPRDWTFHSQASRQT